MSCGNHAHVYSESPGTSETFELLLLHGAEQFWLQFQTDVPNLIQEQGAPIRKLESPLFLHQRTGEGSSFVSE